MQTVSSQDLTLGALFTEFYVVPDFQREFVWEDDAVNQLLQDLFIEFRADNTSLESEYFLGSMVVCVGPEGVYELIDGQQRITTTFLIFCAMRDHLKGINARPIAELNHKISAYDINSESYTEIGVALEEKFHLSYPFLIKSSNPEISKTICSDLSSKIFCISLKYFSRKSGFVIFIFK